YWVYGPAMYAAFRKAGRRLHRGELTRSDRKLFERLFASAVHFLMFRYEFEWMYRFCGHGAGSDGITFESLTPTEWWKALRDAVKQLSKRAFTFKELRQVDIKKRGGGTRTLLIPTCMERVIERVVGKTLSALLDVGFEDTTVGFRRDYS